MTEKIKESLLPRLSVKRPVTVMMVLLCTLVVGSIAYTRIGLKLLPSGLERPYLNVSSQFSSSATPFEVENQLTRPLEELLRTVPGIDRIKSRTRRNDCRIYLYFNQSTNMKTAYAQVRDRIERTMPQLPETVRRINVFKFNEDTDIPIIYFAFNTPETFDDPYHFAESKIKSRLERIDGVANVDFWGPKEKQIYIDFNRQQLQALKVDLYGVAESLRNDNFALSSGYLEDGGTRHLVRSMARFKSLESITNLPLGTAGLKLGDVAEVSYRPMNDKFILRTDGQSSTYMGVWKESMANSVDVSRKVARVLNEEIPGISGLEQLDFKVFFNQGKYILEAIGNIQQTCLWGGLFAVLILLFFLRSARMTAIITLAIPLSLLFTVIVMFFMGWSLNLITMMGMMISIGMVVDNSIVVVENIFRLRQEGVNRIQAAIRGASEVSLAITLSTLTTVVVFLPLMLMDESKNFTFYMIRIGVPVMVALLASLIVALYFIPLGTVRMSPKKQVRERRILSWLNQRYQSILTWTLNHRLDASILLVLLLVSSAFPLMNLRKYDWSEREQERIGIEYGLPNYTSWERSQVVFQKVEDFLTQRKARYGFKNITVRHWVDWGMFEIFRPIEKLQWYEIAYRNIRNKLGIPVDSTMIYKDIIRELNDSLPRFPDAYRTVNWRGDSENDPSMNLVLYGDDTPTLIELAREVKRRLSSIEGLTGVEMDVETGEDELQVQINREYSRQYGLDARRIASTVAYSGQDVRLNEFRSSEKEIQMFLRFSDVDSTNLQKLRSLPIHTSTGLQVPLGTVADFSIQKGQSQIWHENGKTYFQVKATAKKDNMKELFALVDKAMEGFEMPRGYSWNKGYNIQQQREQEETQNFGIILGVIFVFLLMGLLFESFVLPLCVIVAVPFSFCGSYWALYITDTPMELMSMIGLIIMIGVVVNNAIVLVDTIKLYRARGLDRKAALLEAGRHRFRPILMTAATTIGGLIPMAVGGARMMDLSYAPMGRTMIGGLVTSTLVTLVAVPLLYTFFDDLREYGARILAGFTGRLSGKSSTSQK